MFGSARLGEAIGFSSIMSVRERGVRGAGLAVIAVQAVALTVFFVDWDFDDARIVYRIVDHLLHGQGWSYNPGERINPSTSVLNTLLTALIALFGAPRSLAAHLLGGAALFLAGASLFSALATQMASGLALAVASLSISVLAVSRTWGLETMLFIGLLFFVAHQLVQRREPWIPLGLLVLARPDGAVAALLVLAFEWRRRDARSVLRGALIIGAVIAPWALFSLIKFGQIFPSTLSAKIWQGRSGLWGHGDIYLEGLRSHIQSPIDVNTVVLALVGMTLSPRKLRPLELIGVFALIQQGAYVLLNVPPYHWYFVLFDVWRWTFAAIALVWIAPRLWNLPAWLQRREVDLGALALISVAVLWLTLRQFSEERPFDHRDRVYARAAREVDRRAPQARSLAALEVGTIGDMTRRRIVDLTGLTSTNPEYLTGEHSDHFFAHAPDVVVLHNPPWHFERAIADDVRFSITYKALASVADPAIPLSVYGKNPANRGLSPSEFVRARHRGVSEVHERATPSPLPNCVIDTINGRQVSADKTLDTQPLLLVVRGWAAVTSWQSLPPAVTLRLQSGSRAYDYEAGRQARPDVATALGRADFPEAGFSAETAIVDVPKGSYEVLVGQRSAQGEMIWCGPAARINVSGG